VSETNLYRITWTDNVTVEDVEANSMTIDGDGDGCRVTFWRGGVVLSALSREIAEVRLTPEAAQAQQDGGPADG
jgi:hypothetical protein